MPTGVKNEIVPFVMRVEFLWNQGGLPAANVLHLQYTGEAPSSIDCAVMAGALARAWWATMQADYPSSTQLVGATGTDLNSLDGAVGTDAIAEFGTAESGPSPAQCCVLTDWQISRRYRGGHPRTYWPAVAEGAISSPSLWEPDIASDTTTANAALMAEAGTTTSGGTVGAQLVNVSYVTADAYRVDNVVDAITGFTVSGLIRSQRRRVTASTY